MAIEIIKIITRAEDGYEVQITQSERGFGVTIFDTDAEEFIGFVKLFPSAEAAITYADTI